MPVVKHPECLVNITGGEERRYIEVVIDPAYRIVRVTPDEEFQHVEIVLERREKS